MVQSSLVSNVRISIVIPTAGRPHLVSKAIQSTVEAIDATNERFASGWTEVLVVDNNQDADLSTQVESICAEFGNDVKYLREPNPGLTNARHFGAKNSLGNVVTFIDDDVRVSKDWLTALYEAFSDSSIGIVGGPSIPSFTGPVPGWFWKFFTSTKYGGWKCEWLSLLDIGQDVDFIDATYIWGLNYSIRKDLLFELGGFNPDLVPKDMQMYQGDGETGLSIKANNKNIKSVYREKILVFHSCDADRLNIEYFKRRAYYGGVCSSFTDIRAQKNLLSTFSLLAKRKVYRLAVDLFSILNTINPLPEFQTTRELREIRSETNKSFDLGRSFHAYHYKKDIDVSSYVHKDNYL
jgi:glycosyltransferase involved in cell wall biosynthesis